MKNISISKLFMVVIIAFFLAFITDFTNTFSHTNLPTNATFDDFILLVEISFVSSLKGGISAVMASILGYFTNNQKEIKE